MIGFLLKRRRQTTLHIFMFVGLVVGVGLSKWLPTLNIIQVMSLIFCTMVTFRYKNIAFLLSVFCLCIWLGAIRGQFYANKLTGLSQNYGKQVYIEGRVLNDAIYGSKMQLSFDLGSIRLENEQSVPGKISVSGFGVNTILAGNKVLVEGKVFPGYGQYEGRISFAKIRLLDNRTSLIDVLRRNFAAGMETALPEPESAFAMGILVGQRSNMSKELKQAFLMVGLTHVIAVSGYNLTIIVNALNRLLGKSSKRITLILIAVLATGFVVLAGASASIVRAYIVSMLSIIAGYYGRVFRPLNLIILVAAVTALANPRNIWSDISWYLSFLAFYGVLVLSPAISEIFGDLIGKSVVLAAVLESICAEIMCLPLILHIFGQMTFIGLLANALVVPLIPLSMLLSSVAAVMGMIGLWIVGWVALPAKLLLSFMLGIVNNLAALPHIFRDDVNISLVVTLVAYCIIFSVTAFMSYRYYIKKHDIITDKNERSQQMVDYKT